MSKQKIYRIVCLWPSDVWTVQEKMDNGSWMECHRCANKGDKGMKEARKWIDEQQ